MVIRYFVMLISTVFKATWVKSIHRIPVHISIPIQAILVSEGVSLHELLNETLFSSMVHARAVLQAWRNDYNTNRPHLRIGWLTPVQYARNFNPRREQALRSVRSSAPVPDAHTNANFGKTNDLLPGDRGHLKLEFSSSRNRDLKWKFQFQMASISREQVSLLRHSIFRIN